MGGVIFKLISGQDLFTDKLKFNMFSVFSISKKDQVRINSEIKKLKTSTKNKELLKKILRVDPKERANIKESYSFYMQD